MLYAAEDIFSWNILYNSQYIQDIWKETQSSPTVDKLFFRHVLFSHHVDLLQSQSGHRHLCLVNMLHIFLTITCFEVSIKQNTWRYIFNFFAPMFKKNVFKTINNILTDYLPFIKECYFSDEETIHLDSQNQYFKLYVFNMQYPIFTDIIMTTNTTMT